MGNKELNKILAKYQSINIIIIFVIDCLSPLGIMYYLQGGTITRLDAVNVLNLAFKSLSLTMTVIFPIVLVDVFYYSTLTEKELDKEHINEIGTLIEKLSLFCTLTFFYCFIMLGNIRSWLIELYKTNVPFTNEFKRRVSNVEITFFEFGVLALIFFIVIAIKRKKMKGVDYVEKIKLKITNRDFYWIIGILIGIVILVCSIRLSHNANIINIFSFMANGISIALAFLAIGMSIRQELSSNLLNSETRGILISINERIIALDSKVSTIPPENISELTSSSFKKLEDKVNEIINEKVKEGYDPREKAAIKEAVSEEVNKANKETTKQIGNYINKNIYSTIKDVSHDISVIRAGYTDDEWEKITNLAVTASPSFKFEILLESIKNSIESSKKMK